MQSSFQVAAFLSFAIVSSAASFAADSPSQGSQIPDDFCLRAVREAILERHPNWELQDLKARHIRDLSFYQSGPAYHVVEVLTADPADPNPLGPLTIWLGLFAHGKFVRFASPEEVQIYLKRYSKRL